MVKCLFQKVKKKNCKLNLKEVEKENNKELNK